MGRTGNRCPSWRRAAPREPAVGRDAHDCLVDAERDQLGIGDLPPGIELGFWQKVVGCAIDGGAESAPVGIHRGLRADDGVLRTVGFGPSALLTLDRLDLVASITRRPTLLIRSDNGFGFTAHRFRATCRDYRLCRESIRPCTPEQSDMTKALLPTASGSMTSPRTSRRGPRSPNRLAGTTSVVLIRHSATGAGITTGLSNDRPRLEMRGHYSAGRRPGALPGRRPAL